MEKRVELALKLRLKLGRREVSRTGYRVPAAGEAVSNSRTRRLPTSNLQLPTSNLQLPTFNLQLPTFRSAQGGLFYLLACLLLFGCTQREERARPEIAVIPKGTTHEFWKSIHAGALKAAKEEDVEVLWMGPQREDDRQLQIQVVQNFISRKVDAIVLAPLDARSLARPVAAAVDRDIPVVVIDSGLDSDRHSSFVATNNFEGGRLCAQRLAEVMNYQGNAIMLRYQEGSASTTAREKGFLTEIRQIAPEIKILVDNQYAGATMERALQVSQNLLNRFPDVDGIFTPNESSTQGMLRALQTTGKAGEVKLVGFDINEVLLEAMKNGQIDGLTIQDPFDMGYRGVKTAVAILNGERYEEKVDTRMMMVTPENMDEPLAQELINPDLSTWLDE